MNTVANGIEEEKRADRLFWFRPALFAAVFLCLGITYAYYRIVKECSAWWLCLLAPVALLPFFFCKREKREYYKRGLAILLLFAFFLLGWGAFAMQVRTFTHCPTLQGEVTVTGTVESRVIKKEYIGVCLTDISVDGKEVKGRLNAYLPIPFGDDTQISDRLVLQGEIQTDVEITGAYGVRASAITKGRRYTLKVEQGSIVGRSNNLFLSLRRRIERVVYAGMDETPAALTLGLLTGDIAGVEEDLMENIRRGGISHIFAVSGLNVGAVYALCLLLFSKTSLRRAPKSVRLLLMVGFLGFYSGICAFSSSVVRAAILCAIGYFVRLLGTNSDPLSSLGRAGIFILLLSPCELFAVGFQLSFLACVGLMLLSKRIGQVCDEVYNFCKKPFKRRYSEEEKKELKNGGTLPLSVGESIVKWGKEVVSATLAAQITTLPVLLIQFDYLSGWGLILNVVFVPVLDAAFTFLLVAVLVAVCLPAAISGVILYLPSVAWSILMLLFEVLDFSSFALQGVQLSAGFCVCYYGGIAFLSDKWNITPRMKKWLAILLFGCALAVFFLLNC